MQLTDLLAQTGGLRSIARELGVSETQAANGAAALAPAILGGFKKQAQSQASGLEGLGSLLGQLGGGSLLGGRTCKCVREQRRVAVECSVEGLAVAEDHVDANPVEVGADLVGQAVLRHGDG